MFKKLGILALGAGLAIAASSAMSWGGSNAKLPAKAESFEPMRGHAVSAPSTKVAAKRVKKPRLRYFETSIFSVPASGRRDVFLRCPRKYKAINGYFGTDGGIFPDYLASGQSVRRWDFGLMDTTDQQGQAFIGIVCIKGTR
jgi:hypothetical protein